MATYSNVMDVPCEVQVCSMMAHLREEIERDLGYKPEAGQLSDWERKFLVMLVESVHMGDGAVSSLFAGTERHQT